MSLQPSVSNALEISTHEMDGVFKLFNAITRIKKRVGMRVAMEKIVRFTRRKRREDKENHCEFNILEHKQKSRTVNNKN